VEGGASNADFRYHLEMNLAPAYGPVSALLLAGLAWGVVQPGSWQNSTVAEPHDKAGKIRVLQFGDSHTAADNLQIAVRASLQQDLGNGGIGMFLPCATPHPGQERAWTSRCSKGWTLQTRPAPGMPDEFLGLPGMLLETAKPGESIHVEAPFATFRAFFLKQPGGGRVRFLLNGTPIGDLDLAGAGRQPVPYIVSAPMHTRQRVEMRTMGGIVRLLSVTLEDAGSGVVYSPLGVIGARAENLLHVNEEFFARQIAWEDPDLVVLAFGTNEASGAGVDEMLHAAKIGEVVDRLRRSAPAASILLVGPPDRGGDIDASGSMPTLTGIIRAIEATATLKKTGFLDLRAAMGGPGTTSRWAESAPPLAQPDRTHFTPVGYQRLGALIAGAISSSIPKTSIPKSPPEPVSAITYKVRGADGKLTYTTDPELVRKLLVQGGTLIGN
jgi:lysophospholipase L1-like esterase